MILRLGRGRRTRRLYSNGTITSLPEPSDLTGASCQARAINNTGQPKGSTLCSKSFLGLGGAEGI